jgi:hypothetical protein
MDRRREPSLQGLESDLQVGRLISDTFVERASDQQRSTPHSPPHYLIGENHLVTLF